MIEAEILLHLNSEYPREGCGLILNKRGKLHYIACDNVAEDEEEFKISSSDYIRASLQGDIHAIVHSHPDASPEPSDWDKKASNFLGVPYWIYSTPTNQKVVYEPEKKAKPLLGKEYEFGKNDCYSLVRDYYYIELGLKLPAIPFEDDFWLKGINYFDELQESFGFVTVEEPQPHDMVIFNVISDIPNHCGIYLGEDVFLHHAVDRLSCRESLHSFWGKYVTRYIRCKQFI